ncbi:energy transducer TonB [Chryseolinea soli]|nr:energy transducer TonB [Chryseolinea soli]
MRNENAEVPSMDDLVFENRNKEYGAYVIRKAYYDNVHKALFYVMIFFAGVMLLTIFYPGEPLIKVPEVAKKIITFTIPTIEAPRPAAPSAPIRRAATRTTPRVTTSVIPDEIVPPVTDDGSGAPDGAVDGVAPTEGTGPANADPVVATPAVVAPAGPIDIAEVMPQYQGGLQAMARYMQRNLRYPGIARRMEIEGAVFVSFVVNTDGRVIDAKVIKGISKECDEEAVRVVSNMPAWVAGRQGGVPVMVRMVLPIRFQLNR